MNKYISIVSLIMFIGGGRVFAQSQLGSDIDGEDGYDYSGIAVSMNSAGDRVAIGAYLNDGGPGNDAGHVRVYERDASNTTIAPFGWSQLGSDIDGEAEGDKSGGSVSMNSAGDRVAIGARYNDDGPGNDDGGHVRIYEYSSGSDSWTKLGSDIDGEAANDFSGTSVSMNSDGDRVAIGANGNNGTGTPDAGHVRIYEYSSSWTQLGSDIDGEAGGDYSGWSVSMNSDGDRVAIGARWNEGTGYNAGHVRIYEYSSSWSQLGSDIDGEAANDNSGIAVSMNSAGDRVAIGAYWNVGTGTDAGHVRIYEYSSSSWSQLGSDIDGEAAGDRSGYSVSMNSAGDRVAIGAYYNDGATANSRDNRGHVRVIEIGSVTISGNSGFRMMSSPVAGQIYSDLLAELWTQGIATGADVTTGSANVWTYDGSSWNALTDLSSSGNSLTAGQGFLVYVFANTDNDGATNDLPVTLSVSGTENSSSATVGSIASGNWALIGNPYYSTINWDNVTKTYLATSAYVWDSQAGTPAYVSWNGSAGSLSYGLIAPFQGFWVQASGGTGSVTIETADKASPNASNFYKTIQDNTGSMSFSVTSGDYEDRTFVSFMTNGEEGIDNSDAYKLLPMTASERVVGISYAEGSGLDINNLPYIHDGSISIPLDIMYLTLDADYNFVTNENDVTMNWDLSSLPETIIGLTLTNNTTGETTDLLQTDELTFSTTAKGSFPAYGSNGVNIYPEVGESQFTLAVAYSALSSGGESTFPTKYALHKAYPNPFNPSTTITFDVPIESRHAVSLQLYDIKGQLVETLINEVFPAGSHSMQWNPVNLSSGLYIVQLKAGETVFNQKITYIK